MIYDHLGAVTSSSWFDSGCGGARARWRSNGSIETEGEVHGAAVPEAIFQWSDLVRAKAQKHGVPPQLVAGVLALESGGKAGTKSWCCYGLMGLLPDTASWRAGRVVTPAELLENHDLNVDLGTNLIAYLLKQYKGNIVKTVIAYNAGSVKCGASKKCPNAVNQWHAVTDCATNKQGQLYSVDYPARAFKYANDWLAKAGPVSSPRSSGNSSVVVGVLAVAAVAATFFSRRAA